jgi:mono/diheme cytochrome c family protein
MNISYQKIAQLAGKKALAGALIVLGLASCTEDPNSPGIEFMPDMYRSVGYEAYLKKFDIDSTDFFERNLDKLGYAEANDSVKAELVAEVAELYKVFNNGLMTKKPVAGTVAEGKKPFLIAKDNRDAAKAIKMPIPYTEQSLKEGKAFYGIFCDHCHGEKGDGNGPMVSKGVYPVTPPSYAGAAKDLTPGEIYHTIMYGKGAMGSHASQIVEEKRWKIVQYVQQMQGNKLEDLQSGNVGGPVAVQAVDSVASVNDSLPAAE